jgi:hypothetical protein
MRLTLVLLLLLGIATGQTKLGGPVRIAGPAKEGNPASKFGTPANVAFHTTGSFVTSISAPAINTASGDLIVVAVRFGDPITVTSVTDTVSNTYTTLTPQSGGSNGGLVLFYVLGASAKTGNVITANFPSSSDYNWIYVWDVPVTGTATFDVQGGATTSSTVTTLTSSNFSTTGTDEIIFAAVTPNALSETCAISQTGWVLDSGSVDSGGFGGVAHGTFRSAQTGTNVTMTWGSGVSAEIVAGAFK